MNFVPVKTLNKTNSCAQVITELGIKFLPMFIKVLFCRNSGKTAFSVDL